ncbi:FHA domain-containing protein [Gryllotalpicola ginsengisoli]|uniref:FHA domain-containing protein n=1 Tax=Gryllotalpicola ginsengisoli TaxID=444608 RepID=UPI0003B75A89|nr:FHA domain-containing protein [Gryllotalpicola ginsengisoli]
MENGYITPPPGLLPAAPEVDVPRREQVPAAPSFPSFAPSPLGVPAQVPAAPAAPAAAPAEPPVETTSVKVVAPQSVPEPKWSLRLGDGTQIALAGSTFVGRNPVPSDAAPDGAVLPLNDPAKSLSKTHALLVPSNDYLMVTDLHSTNGVAAVAPSGEVTVLEPGRSAAIAPGSTLQLGSFAVTVLLA